LKLTKTLHFIIQVTKTYKVATFFPNFGSQIFIRLSLDPDANKDLYGCQSTAFTSQPCPLDSQKKRELIVKLRKTLINYDE